MGPEQQLTLAPENAYDSRAAFPLGSRIPTLAWRAISITVLHCTVFFFRCVFLFHDIQYYARSRFCRAHGFPLHSGSLCRT